MVKCADCGFLALREHLTQRLINAEAPYRRKGQLVGRQNDPAREPTERLPVCTKGKRDFLDSLMEFGTYSPPDQVSPGEITKLLDSDYPCDSFMQWNQLLTAKEHDELRYRQLMIEREDRRDREMRQREDRRDREARWRHRWELVVFGGLIAAATMGSALIQVYLD